MRISVPYKYRTSTSQDHGIIAIHIFERLPKWRRFFYERHIHRPAPVVKYPGISGAQPATFINIPFFPDESDGCSGRREHQANGKA
jgi:hypothetical protein